MSLRLDLSGKRVFVRNAEARWGAAIAQRVCECGAAVVASGAADILVNADLSLLEGEGASLTIITDVMACCVAAATAGTTRIVNLGSVEGLVPRRDGGETAAASAALFAQSRALAIEWAPRGVRVNAIAAMPDTRPHTPLGRAATPSDVAGAVLFLIADASSYVVGEVLRVDGGWSQAFARQF